MPLLKTVAPDQATGQVKEVYDIMLEKAGVVPKPLQLVSVSPALLGITAQLIKHYMNHPTLGFELLAYIRLLVAHSFDYQYCVAFNAGGLQMMCGLTDEQIEAILENPAQAALNDKDKAMLLFVRKAVKTPEDVSETDIAELHDMGWTDQDIFDATQHGANMLSHGLMFKAFKMDQ